MSVLTAIAILRVFQYTKNGHTIELDDIDPTMYFGDVVKFYANQYPELTTASVTGPEMKGDKMIFKINTTAGVLG